jgi:pyridoxal biosynthesis lyase PdxS
VSKLGNLKLALRGVADELDPDSDLTKRIMYLLASMTSDTAQRILTISKPGEVQRFASGGFAPPNSLFEMSEAGAEAVVMPHGVYRAPRRRAGAQRPRDRGG